MAGTGMPVPTQMNSSGVPNVTDVSDGCSVMRASAETHQRKEQIKHLLTTNRNFRAISEIEHLGV